MSPGPEDPREEDPREDDSPEDRPLEDAFQEDHCAGDKSPLDPPLDEEPATGERREDDPLEDDLFGPDSIEKSLTEALNNLEKILDANDTATGHKTQTSAPVKASVSTDEDKAEQYTIPLLNDVVIPGIDISPRDALEAEAASHDPAPERLDHGAMMAQLTGPAAGTAAGEFVEPELDEAAQRRRLADRLASEVEVIVQARLEIAIKSACDEIRAQVRNHLDITLPEIVDEMLQHRPNRNN